MNQVKSLVILFGLLACVLAADETPAPAPAEPAVPSGPVKCYVCNQKEDSSCGFNPKDEHIQTCENGEYFCRKMIQNVEGDKSVVRQCAKELYKPNYNGCYKTAGKSTQHVCTCDGRVAGDKPCNTAVGVKSSLLAIALSLVIAALSI